MDVNMAVQLIGSLGFPIVACIYLAWDRTRLMKEFMDKMNENTQALESLKTLINTLHEGEL